jgi:hypothetical protein
MVGGTTWGETWTITTEVRWRKNLPAATTPTRITPHTVFDEVGVALPP